MRIKRSFRVVSFIIVFSLAATMGVIWIEAYLNGGEITISVNNFHEALPELLMLMVFFASSTMYFWSEIGHVSGDVHAD